MNFKQITAIIPPDVLEDIENELRVINVQGMTVSHVHGMGEYKNFYAKDLMTDCIRIEIITDASKTQQVVNTVAKVSHLGSDTDGVIAVFPVEEFIHIKDYEEA